jgi:hypothetical protein
MYYKEPKENMSLFRLAKPNNNYFIFLYELDEKKSRTNPVYRENYGYNNNTIQILYYYKNMIQEDGIMTDNELIPIIINTKKYRIIGSGWPFLDSIRKINYLKRN